MTCWIIECISYDVFPEDAQAAEAALEEYVLAKVGFLVSIRRRLIGQWHSVISTLQALHADHEKAAPESAPMPLIQTMFTFSGTESYLEDGIGFCSTRVRAQKPILTTAMPKMALIRSVR